MRANYSSEKRRRELAAKQKKAEKAVKAAERKTLKGQLPSEDPANLPGEDLESDHD